MMGVVEAVAFLTLYLISQVSGVVEVIELDSPQLFKVGQEMMLKCISNEQEGLYWSRETPATDWRKETISIHEGSDWEERYLTVRPSGYVENVLVRKKLQAGDGGNYICNDNTNMHSFSTFVHVLRVLYKNVTASKGETVTLTCSLSGFTTNPPRIDQMWVRDKRMLGPRANKDKYNITVSDFGRTQSLIIQNPGSQDNGPYQCSFTLYTRNGYVTFEELVFLEAGHLPDSMGVSGKPSVLMYYLLITTTLVLLLRI